MISRRLFVPVLAMFLVAGCATNSSVDEVRALAERALRTAEAADSKADSAMNTAKGAQTCCNANTERLERAFEDSMRK